VAPVFQAISSSVKARTTLAETPAASVAGGTTKPVLTNEDAAMMAFSPMIAIVHHQRIHSDEHPLELPQAQPGMYCHASSTKVRVWKDNS
jgi:hypothetical protein